MSEMGHFAPFPPKIGGKMFNLDECIRDVKEFLRNKELKNIRAADITNSTKWNAYEILQALIIIKLRGGE